jgi:DNA modification methylase
MELNKIYNEDCLETMRRMPGESVDMILSDPPYGISFLSNWTDHQKKIKNDGLKEWQEALPQWFKEFKRILTPSGICCCCGGGGGGKTPVTALFTLEAIKHFNLIQTVVWVKTIGLGWRYRPSYENIVILSKSKDKYNFYDTSKKRANIITGINQKIPQKGEHPTVKPVKLMEKLLLIHSQEGDLIYDPFAGSGTTGVAAARLSRRFILSELEKEYCDIAQKRIDEEMSQRRLF